MGAKVLIIVLLRIIQDLSSKTAIQIACLKLCMQLGEKLSLLDLKYKPYEAVETGKSLSKLFGICKEDIIIVLN
jgi:hypothetical protein